MNLRVIKTTEAMKRGWSGLIWGLVGLSAGLPDATRAADEKPPGEAAAKGDSAGAGPGPDVSAPVGGVAADVRLQRIVIVETMAQVATLPPAKPGQFIQVADTLKFLNLVELEKRLAGGQGRPVTEGLLVGINQVLEGLVKNTESPLVVATIPPQKIDGGVVTVLLTLGRYREIKFLGNRWYSEALLREKLGIGQGDLIRIGGLDQAIGLTNGPYRTVKAHIDPIPNTTDANLLLSVQERLPLRLTAMADTSGNDTLGNTRFMGGFSYANLWGREHQMSYTYITSEKAKIFGGHIFDYTLPMPQQQVINLSASYLRARPRFYDGLFEQDGKNLSAEVKYSRPVRIGKWAFDGFVSGQFKETNNNLAFGGESVLASKVDIFQVNTGLSRVIRDAKGGWALALTLTASPGGMNARNTTAAFDDARLGAKADYLVGNLSIQRLLKLGGGWELFSRATLQRSSSNLLSSEQFNMGGAATVRGYRENTVSGDRGWQLSNEVSAPGWVRPAAVAGKFGLSELRAVGFYEVAAVAVQSPRKVDGEKRALASMGLGLRMRMASRLTLNADYGWKLVKTDADRESGRGHVKMIFAY